MDASARVAVARKLAVIMHAMWSDGTFYSSDAGESPEQVTQRARKKDQKHLGRPAKAPGLPVPNGSQAIVGAPAGAGA
ncbi:hypothetical protein ACIPRI_25565 [Variovorax sp. LARHSF232]